MSGTRPIRAGGAQPALGGKPAGSLVLAAALGAMASGATACGAPIGGPLDSFGQLRVQPAFVAGDAPEDLGLSVDRMRVELRRSDTGALHADTVLPYAAGAVPSWVLALRSESDPVAVRLTLLHESDTLYAGTREVWVEAGTIGSAPIEDVEVRLLGDGGTEAVRDSVTYALEGIVISTSNVEALLGTFAVPPHVAALGVEVRVDIELSFDEQRDEAFALGALEDGEPAFIGDPACPVVPDDPTLGRAWVRVGRAALPEGERPFLARHAVAFDCYEPVDGFAGANSVHFFGIRFVFYRER